MKTTIVGVVIPVLVACGGTAAEPETATGTTTEEPQSDEPVGAARGDEKVAGGYREVATDREDVVETAQRAVELLKTRTDDSSLALQSIELSETQVVAGKNTRLRMVLTGANGERTVTVVVHRNLDGEESLSSVEGL